jgi:hypothetical protein
MSENKCCGNCKHFNNEDVEGWGWCSLNKTKRHCAQSWDCHNSTFNGWTEITPDNVEELYNIPEELLIVAFKLGDTIYYQMAKNMSPTLNTLAKAGGYYYYVLPELKIE